MSSVNGSPDGVMTAARNNRTTTACLRYLRKNALFTSHSFDNNHDSNGSSKTSPITKIIIRKFPI